MKYNPWKLRAGYAGLGLATLAAFAAAGLSPLVPVLAGSAVYALRRWSPLYAWRERRSYEDLVKNYAALADDHPLYKRVADIAARMNAPMPRVYLVPPRAGEFNVYIINNVSRRNGEGGLLMLPAALYTVTCPGRPTVLTVAEQDAVIAHEMTHMLHSDSRTMTGMTLAMNLTMGGALFALLGVMSGGLTVGASWFALLMMGGSLALSTMCQRQMEYRADEAAVHVAGARPLATALEKMNKAMDHMALFANNTQALAREQGSDDLIAMFRPRPVPQNYRPPQPSVTTQILMRYFSTHPSQESRYAHMRRRAEREGQPALPPRAPSVADEMRGLLCRTDDGIILPPFAIPETLVRDEKNGTVAVSMGITSLFNAAARGETLPSMRPRAPDGPRPPAP